MRKILKAAAAILSTLILATGLWANELIIYRPQNSDNINLVRCFVKIEDEDGNDVTGIQSKNSFAYMDRPGDLRWYQNQERPYLDGGMACHLFLNTHLGQRYRISVYTPKRDVEGFDVRESLKTDWDSDVFVYDSSRVENSVDGNYNPLRVLFVYPTADENWFYRPHWAIGYRAPTYLGDRYPQFTRPRQN